MHPTSVRHTEGGSHHGPASGTSSRFRRAAAAVVEDAREHVHDVAWLVTRADGEDLIVLCAASEEPTVMVGERIHLRPDEDISVALEFPDGSVFGALCGLGAHGQGTEVAPTVTQVQRLADLLNAVLSAEWDLRQAEERADAESRRARLSEEEALHDALTGLANRRAWDRALEVEERRCRRYGNHTAVIVVDVDAIKEVNDSLGHAEGDDLLRQVARALEATSRDSDLVARTGGDEFAILALDCGEPHLRVLTVRVRRALEEARLAAAVGGACRIPGAGLAEAWAQADAAMYADKYRRRVSQDGGAGTDPGAG